MNRKNIIYDYNKLTTQIRSDYSRQINEKNLLHPLRDLEVIKDGQKEIFLYDDDIK